MKHVGCGTQKVEEELGSLFPDVPVLRMDADTAASGHSALLERFEKERIPILLGTQMVAKGLDFENVTLVGVLSADLSLYVDHYQAAERTFNLLTQVVGRAGRGGRAGRAVIQTYTPENDVIRSAAAQDYEGFTARRSGCAGCGNVRLLRITFPSRSPVQMRARCCGAQPLPGNPCASCSRNGRCLVPRRHRF